jgi:hypothetical protein
MGKSKEKTFFIHYLPIYGSFSTGLMYAAIGVIAILSFLKLKDGGQMKVVSWPTSMIISWVKFHWCSFSLGR